MSAPPRHDIDALFAHAAGRRRLGQIVGAAVAVAVIAAAVLVTVLVLRDRPADTASSRRKLAAASDEMPVPDDTAPAPSTTYTLPPVPTSVTPVAPDTAPAPATVPPTAAAPGAAVPTPGAGATSYTFPVQPAGPAKPSSSHHDYPASDVFAPCGSDFVSPVAGTVQDVSRVDTWNSKTDDPAVRGGLSVSVVGDDGVRYYGAHLREIEPAVASGVHVTSGEKLGLVGNTGNAAGMACHLHFGISPPTQAGDYVSRRGVIWPQKYLASWKNGGQLSPVAEIGSLAKH